jgi:hypothetical protein
MKQLFLFLILLGVAGGVLADDVMDWIDDGIESYKKKDYSEAVTSLEYAAQLIRQMKGEEMTAALPEALSGWKKISSEAAAAGAAMFGGGTSASARYEKGDASCEISITSDNPMLGGLLMMFSNPMMIGASGKKLIKLNGQKGALEYSGNSGEITVIVDDKVLVMVAGDEISEDDLRAYAKAVDYDFIEKLSGK